MSLGDKNSHSIDPRPPKDRKDAGGESSRKGRRTRDAKAAPPSGGGIMHRITGRSEMDRAKVKRYEPYGYESNNKQVKWVVAVLIGWILVSLILAWQDRSTANYLIELKSEGLVSVPPSQQRAPLYIFELAEFSAREGSGLTWQQRFAARYPYDLAGSGMADTPDADPEPTRDLDTLFRYAESAGVACTSERDFVSRTDECLRLIEIQEKYTSVKDTGAMLFVLLISVLFLNMFAFGSFSHRASRNVLALNNEGQKFTPEKAVLWFFVPVINMVRPWQVFKELFKGSDPDVTTYDQHAWKAKGRVPNIVHVWAAVFVGVFLFNPRTIGWFWYSVRQTMDDVIVAHQRLIIADILMAILGIAAIFVALELHKRQEARHAKVGDVTVTPPAPVDALKEALKEGIMRKDLENRRNRSKRNDSSK